MNSDPLYTQRFDNAIAGLRSERLGLNDPVSAVLGELFGGILPDLAAPTVLGAALCAAAGNPRYSLLANPYPGSVTAHDQFERGWHRAYEHAQTKAVSA